MSTSSLDLNLVNLLLWRALQQKVCRIEHLTYILL